MLKGILLLEQKSLKCIFSTSLSSYYLLSQLLIFFLNAKPYHSLLTSYNVLLLHLVDPLPTLAEKEAMNHHTECRPISWDHLIIYLCPGLCKRPGTKVIYGGRQAMRSYFQKRYQEV